MKTQTFLTLALSSFVAAQSNNTTLADAISGNDDLSALNTLLEGQSGILEQLADLENITLLAPSNDALSEFLNSTNITEALAADVNIVAAILSYHVLNGTYYASNFTDTPMFIPTLLNNATYENITGGQVVEGVAMNETVSFYSGLRHQSNVTSANLNFTGGTIHIVNSLLQIPRNLSDTAIAANLTAAAGALTKADLISDVGGLQNITVFVPTNGAFSSIGSIFANLSEDDLQNVLEYHVVAGTIGYSSMLENMTLETVEGEDVRISVSDGDVFVNNAKVIIPDVLISNGVVHVIDGVLNPENSTATADPTASTQAPAFEGASSASDIPFTSGVPQATDAATGLNTATSTEAGAHATAAVALGALFGGAALAFNY